jgi:hypothetical protein
MSFKKFHVLFANVQRPLIIFAPPNIYVLELSPANTQCTHGIVVKLSCRYRCPDECEVALYSPLHGRPWIGRIQDEL